MNCVEVNERELFTRHASNPILTGNDFPNMINSAFNAGVTMYDGQTLLLVRVEDRTGLSSLVVATSDNGIDNWKVDADRALRPQIDRPEEHWGVEDPRITQVGDEYFIVYTGYSTAGPLVCMAVTRDFMTFERRGVLMPPEDKDAALFPVMFEGRWALLHRPVPHMSLGAHVWLSFSPDLLHWGDGRVLLPARRGGWWDANKVGLGPPPLLTRDGWLVCYHGVKTTVSGQIYRLGLALLDRDDPTVLLARGNEWVFGPCAPYELSGDVPNVVFPCGWLIEDNGDTIRMYYGASDTSMCLATASVTELLDHLHAHPFPGDLPPNPVPLSVN
jgi:predicted GH43/DUF377 family glycosyl hydrolase